LRVISATELKSVHFPLLRNGQTENVSRRWWEMHTVKAFNSIAQPKIYVADHHKLS